jgi:hypothetical protein
MALTEKTPQEDGIRLTPEQQKARRQRSIAIGWSIGLLVIIFWAVTLVRLGSSVFQRPM